MDTWFYTKISGVKLIDAFDGQEHYRYNKCGELIEKLDKKDYLTTLAILIMALATELESRRREDLLLPVRWIMCWI